MNSEPRWTPEAVEDLQSGSDWYDERRAGLGRLLAVEVFATLDVVMRHPLVPRKYEQAGLPATPEVRTIQLQRFDEYNVVYAVVDETLWVLAVAHSKRQPGYWRDRLTRFS